VLEHAVSTFYNFYCSGNEHPSKAERHFVNFCNCVYQERNTSM